MTLDEARDHVGDGVVYKPRCGHAEGGVVRSVGQTFVFVGYGDGHAKATDPADLELAPSAGRRSYKTRPRCGHPMRNGEPCGKPDGHPDVKHESAQTYERRLDARHQRYLNDKAAKAARGEQANG